MIQLDSGYWENRYQNKTTGWDIGSISTPIKAYIDQLDNKDLDILIPGAGNAYEAGYLWERGFRNVIVLDYASSPLDRFRKAYPDFPKDQLIKADFFDHEGSYDLVIEQTFFCAIAPRLRAQYVKKVKSLLKQEGKLVGLLWNKPMNLDQPPYGGSEEEYWELFQSDFNLHVLETAYNSISPRLGNEVFINFRRKGSD